MPQTTIQNLPTEILDRILFYVTDCSDEGASATQTSIKNLRLVSRRFKEVTRLVVSDKLTVCLATKSLSRLEGLALHPEFRECITNVTIDLSYYDIQLVEDIDCFGEHMSAELFRALELAERRAGPRNRRISVEDLSKTLDQLWHVPHTLKKLRRFQHDDAGATIHQKNLIKLHKEYVRLYVDQESIRTNNLHVWRLVTALNNLPNLDTIHLSDRLNSGYGRTHQHILFGDKPFDDPEFLISALMPSRWDGFMMTAFKTTPPIEMLGALLSRCGNSGLRPRRIAISLGVPVDLTILRPTRAQAAGINRLVSKSSEVDLLFRGWARGNSLANNNDRSRNEMLSLGSLITALTRTSTVRRLILSLYEHPVFTQYPNVSLSDLLQSNLTLWPNLSHIDLNHITFDLEELVAIVGVSREINSFVGTSLHLRHGDWVDALDVLRGLKTLESCELHYPRAGRYGERLTEFEDCCLEGKAEAYVLRKTAHNPLHD